MSVKVSLNTLAGVGRLTILCTAVPDWIKGGEWAGHHWEEGLPGPQHQQPAKGTMPSQGCPLPALPWAKAGWSSLTWESLTGVNQKLLKTYHKPIRVGLEPAWLSLASYNHWHSVFWGCLYGCLRSQLWLWRGMGLQATRTPNLYIYSPSK